MTSISPPFLNHNDEVRIVSPSGSINPVYIEGATKTLAGWGLNVTEGKFSRMEYGRFAGTKEQRIADLQDALNDTSVKAILCSRGGYGLAQIIDKLDFTIFSKSPKWLIGFSDITILHNIITNLGIPSIHAVMAKPLAQLSADCEQINTLKGILFGKFPAYTIPHHVLNKTGKVTGRLIGGNLSILLGMRGSQFDLNFNNAILFIEDVAEKPYHIDRMLQNLRFSGILASLSGLIVGQFSDCDEDPLMKQSVVQIISSAVSEYNYPVCFNFPAGHIDYNVALILGREVSLEVTENDAKVVF